MRDKGFEPSTSRSEDERSIQLKLIARHDWHVIYIGFSIRIRFKFFIIFFDLLLRPLTVWINQSISKYKVLNLLQGPLTLKDKFKFENQTGTSISYNKIRCDYEIARDRDEVVIEFSCVSNWNEAQPCYEAKLPLRKLSLRCFNIALNNTVAD